MITRPWTMGASEVRRCWLQQMSKCHEAVSHSTLLSGSGLSRVYMRSFKRGCSGFGLILLFSLSNGLALAMFDGWLNTRHLAAFCKEAVKLSDIVPCVCSNCGWRRWTNRWMVIPMLTASSNVCHFGFGLISLSGLDFYCFSPQTIFFNCWWFK